MEGIIYKKGQLCYTMSIFILYVSGGGNKIGHLDSCVSVVSVGPGLSFV